MNPLRNLSLKMSFSVTSFSKHWILKIYIYIGCNIGIPVPREPFSFGGLYGTKSKYGQMDITGDGAIEFFSNRIKVTSKWPSIMLSSSSLSTTDTTTSPKTTTKTVVEGKDVANFAGSM